MSKESGVLEEILKAREKRARMQRELINIYRTTLISFTLNVPGAEKNNPSFTKIHKIGIYLLEEELKKQNIKLVHKIVQITADGDEAFLNVNSDSLSVKKITAAIEENHELGRLFDFDVFNVKGEQFSRRELGLPERKCLLCNDSAKVCGRSRKHSVDELLNKIYELIDCYSNLDLNVS
ncbi:citrate lyase holo-[acyl-carrier protein] synthase [Clostridium thailandense]|uniref:citrate lyase holo-[acyl-carrier protein] synthase n=1 Tax=Clostridium thailandense TaxID=2794346 RepID=UPI003988D197